MGFEAGGRQASRRHSLALRQWINLLVASAFFVLMGSSITAAAEKSTVEEILDILKNRNIISEQEYTELLERAEVEAHDKEPPNALRAYYKDGVNLKTKDDAFHIKLGGRLNIDAGYVGADSATKTFLGDEEFGWGIEFRRARLYMSGSLYRHFEFKSEFDFFLGEQVVFNDVWLGMKDIPYIGRLRVGHMKEPYSLNYMTSGKWTTFMERGLPFALTPKRNLGIAFMNQELDDRLTWAVGVFRQTNQFGGLGVSDDNELNVTVRLTGVPWLADDGRKLLHLGFSYSHLFRDEDNDTTIRYLSFPESFLAPINYVDTEPFVVNSVDMINPEFALVYGPFSLQAEYMHNFAKRSENNPDFWGWYVFGSYFLTGEHRPYKNGAFQRIRPNRNFLSEDGGWGAWEVALRYSFLDLSEVIPPSNEGRGNKLGDFTAGLNWYLNQTIRLMLNYIFADLDDIGDTHIFQTRFHIEF